MANQIENAALLKEIREEHEALRELLGTISKTLSSGKDGVAEVSSMLASLREHLDRHFADEEEIGFFEKVAEREPRFAEKTEVLRAEHEKFRTTIKDLAEFVAEKSAWWAESEKRFHQFSTELMHHESAENELLLDAYMRDIGPGD